MDRIYDQILWKVNDIYGYPDEMRDYPSQSQHPPYQEYIHMQCVEAYYIDSTQVNEDFVVGNSIEEAKDEVVEVFVPLPQIPKPAPPIPQSESKQQMLYSNIDEPCGTNVDEDSEVKRKDVEEEVVLKPLI
ncbi:hypothetical protein HAX54_014181 [Datura stramonium]|uniref:Uncharacterized protein n=1 Tax=Datura stramonium TaxID=4076 RepID=A0ABS8TMP1_DATST|nr:hypothetical protein [Datura stramonium]